MDLKEVLSVFNPNKHIAKIDLSRVLLGGVYNQDLQSIFTYIYPNDVFVPIS